MNNSMTITEAVPQYVRHLQARGLGPRTIKTHQQPLNRALVLWGDILVSSIKPHHIDHLFESSGWAPRTLNLYLSTTRNFFAWCRRTRLIPRDYDPTDGWRSVRAPQTEKLYIPIEEFGTLLDSCDNARDRGIVALGLFTFMRGSEISTLKVGDLDLDRHELRIYRHKTKQADVMPVSTELAGELTRWLNAYRKQLGTLRSDWYLVPARGPLPMLWSEDRGCLQPTGEPAPLRPSTLMRRPYAAVRRAVNRLGYDDKGQGVHLLRRSGARALFDRLRHEGYDGALMRVSSMLGHADTKTTEIYLGLGLEREQRNELLAGRPMFPDVKVTGGTVVRLEVDRGDQVAAGV